MASADYYDRTTAAQQMKNQKRLNPSAPQQPQHPYQQPPLPSRQQFQHYPYTPPPPYSPHPQQQQQRPQEYPPPPQHQQHHGYPSQYQPYPSTGRPPTSTPYPQSPPMGPRKYPQQPQQQSRHLGVPLQVQRSHSQPPRVRFADEYDSESIDPSYASDSDSPRRRHRRRKHRHSHSDCLDRSSSRNGDYERSHHRDLRRKDHRDQNIFLSAGAGSIIGDAIFPSLGTAAGLLLGGYGGRKTGQRRSRGEVAADRQEHHGRRKERTSG